MQTNNKLREALETLVDVVDAWKDHLPPVIRDGELARAIKKAEAALAEPVKNYEVGTAEEQEERFRNYCWNHSSRDKNMECQCPIDAEGKAGCKLRWAQLPYEEGGER